MSETGAIGIDTDEEEIYAVQQLPQTQTITAVSRSDREEAVAEIGQQAITATDFYAKNPATDSIISHKQHPLKDKASLGAPAAALTLAPQLFASDQKPRVIKPVDERVALDIEARRAAAEKAERVKIKAPQKLDNSRTEMAQNMAPESIIPTEIEEDSFEADPEEADQNSAAEALVKTKDNITTRTKNSTDNNTATMSPSLALLKTFQKFYDRINKTGREATVKAEESYDKLKHTQELWAEVTKTIKNLDGDYTFDSAVWGDHLKVCAQLGLIEENKYTYSKDELEILRERSAEQMKILPNQAERHMSKATALLDQLNTVIKIVTDSLRMRSDAISKMQQRSVRG